jgi:hypothetical protein
MDAMIAVGLILTALVLLTSWDSTEAERGD